VGAFVFVLAKDLLSSRTEHWMIPFGVIFVLFVLLAPDGIGGLARRLVRRHGIEPARRPPAPVTATGRVRAGDVATERNGQRPIAGEVVLAATGLIKRFGAMVAVSEVTVDARRGEIHAIIGPNGAGKTTLFNVLTGVTLSDEGRVTLGGQNVSGERSWQRVRRGLARSFQITSVFKELTALENVRLAVEARTASRSTSVARRPPLAAAAGGQCAARPVGLAGRETEVVVTLSHGEQRQLGIAIALGTHPAVLLLDEPLAGLPDAERGRIVELIKQLARDYAVLLIEHDIDRVLEISNRLTVMHEGRVIATGTPAEIQASAAVQEAYVGRPARKARIPARARTAADALLLRLEKINTFYGASHILHDVSLEVRTDEIACLLGRNGVGTTTTLRTIMGAPPPRSGRVTIDAIEAQGWRPHQIARLGLTIVPEGARVFPNLTVMEHIWSTC
jgi:ABC-type branched-subunit amino acid transport system ATPase component